MKKKSILGQVIFILITLLSCDKFLEETNINPNDPTKVSPSALLTPAELTLAYE